MYSNFLTPEPTDFISSLLLQTMLNGAKFNRDT